MTLFIDSIWQDLRRSCRALRRNPGLACIAAMTLAIGIGSCTAIFSFVDAVLLKPLPYNNADRIVRILERRPTGAPAWISTRAYLDWKANSTAFEQIAAFQQGLATLHSSGDPVPLRVGRVTAHYFDVFGVRAALGRTFAEGDDTLGKEHVVVLSNRTWRTQFGADREIVGKTITLDNEAYVVIGVLPADSAFDRGTAQIWYPLAFRPFNMTWDYRWLNASFGMLKPGVSVEQARQEMEAIAARIARDFPESNKGWGIAMDRYAHSLVGPEIRTSLLALMAAVTGLLLICCSNLTSLMLVRAVSKQGEFAVRVALGAGRLRLVRQLAIEYLVTTAGGAALGIGFADTSLSLLARLLPAGMFPSEATIQIDLRVLTFALTVSLLAGLAFALVPAIRVWRQDPVQAMRGLTRGSTAGSVRGRLLDGLVVGEVAIAFVLLCGSALLIRSFVALIYVETGFAADNVLTMTLPVPGFPPGSIYTSPDEFKTYLKDLITTIEAIPGVRRAAVTNSLPLTECCLYTLSVQVANRPTTDRANRGGGFFKIVTPSYFEALGLTLRKGRFLDEHDIANSVPAVVINERLATRYFPGEDPIGQHLFNPRIIPGKTERGADVSWEIVGVVGNEKISGLNDDTSDVLYASYEQSPAYFANLAVRSAPSADRLENSVRQSLHNLNPGQAILDVRTLEAIKDTSVASGRLQTVLMSTFSAIALLLATIGMYGVIGYSVALRLHEIGIRAALGASASNLLRAVLTRGLVLTALGLAIGLIAALALTPLLSTVLYRVQTHDPYLIAGVAAALLLVSMFASLIPARRAAKVDPIIALHGD